VGDPGTVATPLRILAVDDEGHILSLLRRVFFGYGTIFIDAASAAEGLDILRLGGRFDVVISGYRMPAMDGIRFLAEVSTLQPRALRILMGAQVPRREMASAFDAGIVHFQVPKPWDNIELLALIEAGLPPGADREAT
jgi:two-component system cell cycle sensor histidine kinase/response regulator CckA